MKNQTLEKKKREIISKINKLEAEIVKLLDCNDYNAPKGQPCQYFIPQEEAEENERLAAKKRLEIKKLKQLLNSAE